MAPEPPRPIVPGHLLREVIGRGASSTVYAARASATGRDEAVKVTSSEAHDADYVMAIAERVQAIQRRVSGDHVVQLREALPLVGGTVALVLDLADGGNLAALVGERGALEPGEVTTVVTPIATTLAELHAAGIVHGGLDPENVLFTRDGKPTLAGFGSARLVDETHPQDSSSTAGFIAPEVRAGGLPTEASDVWALAALAWFALTGGQNPPERTVVAVAPSTVGPRFAEVLVPMLAADPAARPSARASAAAIYRAVLPVPVRLPQQRRDPGAEVASTLRSSARPPAPRATRRRSLSTAAKLTLVLIAGLVFVVVFLFLLSRFGSSSDPKPPPATSASPSSSSPTSSTPKPSPTTTSPTDALRASPAAVMQGLWNARAVALVKGDPALLDAAEIRGSGPYADDAAIIAQLKGQQRTYAGLTFRVRTAALVGVSGSTAEVVAVVDRGAYTVIGPGAAREAQAAQQGRAYRYTLTLTAQGWRLSALSAS